jgi:autotransporter-associated beta strand protein
MIQTRLLPLAVFALMVHAHVSAQSIPSPTFGNLNVQQNDSLNNASSVTVTVDYGQAARSADGVTSLGNLAVRAGSNRGDFTVGFTPTPANDRTLGIMLSHVSQIYRDNTAFGDTIGPQFVTSATASDTSGYVISVHTSPGGDEFNVNLAAAWFPYADGWIGGHAVNSTNGGVLTSLVGSSGLTLSTTAAGSNVLYDPGQTGQYELNLSGINSQADGILIVSGGKNEDNFAYSLANADGTWSIFVRDNGNGSALEADSLAFAYIPTTSVVTGANPGVHAMGRLNGNLTRDITAGNYAVVRTAAGKYRLLAPGIDPAQSTLLLSPEYAGIATDNILLYEPTSNGWNIEMRDLPTPITGLQDNTGTADTFSFVLMAGQNTSATWDAGGANTNWSTAANWVGDAVPASGTDVVIGASGTGAIIDTAQVAGMVMINRNTSFNISGTSTLTLNEGLVVNGAPTSSQIFTISAPLVLADDAFLISQTTGSAITLRLNVASGNAVTSSGKNLTLGGSTNHEFLDPINLGTGLLIKEGAGQTTLTTASTVGGTVIISGPNSSTNGAIRLNGAGAYNAFGSTITLQNASSVTALYFDAGAGSGTLASNIVLQSTVASLATRFTTDAASAFNATLSGLISGGNLTSEFWVDNESATGQGRLHLTNTGNTFVASYINLNRGGLVIYGDGSLGHADNDLYLNNNNTTALLGNGLHFGADNIALAATRNVVVNTTTTIHSGAYHGSIHGVMTGAGGIIKAGSGVLELKGNNNYAGGTTVNGGTLLFTPSLPSDTAGGSGGIIIQSGATLAGAGTVTGWVSVESGGFLSPGAVRNLGSELQLNGGLSLAAGAEVTFNLFGAAAHDRVVIAPAATLDVNATSVLKVVLQGAPSFMQSFDLLDWVILTGDTNLADNLDFSQADISGYGWFWDTSAFNTTGVITAVPEPSRALLLLAGLAGLTCRRGRRRSHQP